MAAETSELLKPTVLWAQRRDMVLLRVMIQPTEKPDFRIYDTHMNFKGYGIGGSSYKKLYGFELVFHEAINTEKCRVKISETEVEFRLLKKNSGEWSKLQSSHVKPHWIKPDFEHFEVSEGEEEEDDDMIRKKELEKELKRLQDEAQKQLEWYNKVSDFIEKLKALYLVLYNAGQWVGFLLISTRLLFLLAYGWEGLTRGYDDVVPLLSVCQGLAVLEIIHPLLGLVKGDVMSSIMQVAGRNFLLFLILPYTPSIQSSPVVYALFLIWSLIELVRYPYYALSIVKREISWITWLRYTLWIPLYPLGFSCECIIYTMSIIYGPVNGGWSYDLPNPLNISISLNAIKIMLLIFGPFLFSILLGHMGSQRKKRLGAKKKTT